MSRRSRTVSGIVLLAGVVVALAPAVAGGPEAPPARGAGAPAAGRAGGTDSCRPCHERETRAWEASAHATTLRAADARSLPPEAVAGGRVVHAPGETSFRPEGKGFVATTAGPTGAPLSVPVAWVVGGRRVSMFVGLLEDGRLQVLPAMREEPSGPWFDYTHLLFGAPGADPAVPPVVAPGDDSFWTGAARSFDARCARCHASGAEPVPPDGAGRGPRSRWRAPGVDCEACHGEGAAHGAFWRALPADRSKDPILRTSALDRERSVALCLECHMEGAVAGPAAALGHALFERFVPTLLDDGDRVDATGRPLELVYDGLPFLTGACAERGGLTCLTCHDAHGGIAHASQLRAAPDGRGQCAACHRAIAAAPARHSRHAASGSGGTCLACHMPPLGIERGHGAVRDHTIGVPRLREGGPRAATDACTACHDGGRLAPAGSPVLAPERVRTAFAAWWPHAGGAPAWSAAIEAARAGDAAAPAALDEVLASAKAPRVVRASAARLLGRFPAALAERARALAADPDPLVRAAAAGALASVRGPGANAALLAALGDSAPAVRREAARAVLSGWERARANRPLLLAALPALEADAAAAPDDDGRWFLLGAARQLAGDLAGAVEAYERQLALDPFATRVREHLATLRLEAARAPR